MHPFVATLVALLLAIPSFAREVSECSCGFADDRTSSFYTDSLILYLNETDAIDPAILQAQEFAHKKQQGWNSVYRIGADPSNARLVNVTDRGAQTRALELSLDPPTNHHLVSGATLESTRRDIQYGLFEAALRPASPRSGGTVFSFGVNFNRSQGAAFDFMNANNPQNAQLANLVNGEWPSPDLVTNFTTLEDAGQQPWQSFTAMRFSWNDSVVAFDVAGNTTRLVTKRERSLPFAGQGLKLQTWSTGDDTFGYGPPMHNATQSYALYIRAFFNSTVMTTSQHLAFDARCAGSPRCSVDDTSLRGYTNYTSASEKVWKQPPRNQSIRKLAGIVAACCSSFGMFALANVFLRRMPWHKLWPKKARVSETPEKPPCDPSEEKSKKDDSLQTDTNVPSGAETPLPAYGAQTPRSGAQTPAPSYHTTAGTPSLRHFSSSASLSTNASSRQNSTVSESPTNVDRMVANSHKANHSVSKLQKAMNRISEMSNVDKDAIDGLKSVRTARGGLEEDADVISPVQETPGQPASTVSYVQSPAFMVTDKSKQSTTSANPVDESKGAAAHVVDTPSQQSAPPTKRVDYLAGLTSCACVGVTLHHFLQTFWPFVIEGYGPSAHYPKVEKWLHIFVGNIILTNLWIGPFFLTATRFLTTNYLKHGNLEDIAKKELRRAPRLFVPIIIVSLLQYFLISMGLTTALQWLPSVTWSAWPYVEAQANFAVYMNNIVQLAYLIPNAVPEISSHYCIGVLWTIPVQLQFTYVVLAAAVVMRDIRKPWKRFGVYALVILAGWYARSWSACHWGGLVLSDLEATYQWRKRLQKRPLYRYAILTGASLSALGAALTGAFNSTWSFNTAENSIHPDIATGKPIMALQAIYPSYQEPTLTILLFSLGLQIVVELSTWVQAFLSLKLFLLLNPLIFTIYLTHGFVMWTWGAWVALACNGAGLPYWANLLITWLTTYVLIFALARAMAPLLEFPTQALMRNLDRWSKEEPLGKRATTAPFSKDIVLNRKGSSAAVGEA